MHMSRVHGIAAHRVVATVKTLRLRPVPVHELERHPVRVDIPLLLCAKVPNGQLERAIAFPQRA
jgi:hypothetical protein